jgi:predicted ATPase
VVLLSGEPGIGKSRLIAALQERIENEPHTRMRYFCSPQRQDIALHPIIAQLERATGFEREDTPEVKLDKLAVLARASPEDGALLAELLSLPTEGPLSTSPAHAPTQKGEIGSFIKGRELWRQKQEPAPTRQREATNGDDPGCHWRARCGW